MPSWKSSSTGGNSWAADLTIVDRDLEGTTPEEIDAMLIWQTMLDGEILWSAEGGEIQSVPVGRRTRGAVRRLRDTSTTARCMNRTWG